MAANSNFGLVFAVLNKTSQTISGTCKGGINPVEEHEMLQCEEPKEASDSIADKCTTHCGDREVRAHRLPTALSLIIH